MRLRKILAVLGLLVVLISSLVFPRAGTGQAPAGPQLRLQRGTFDAREANRQGPTTPLAVPAPGPYSIIQFAGPVSPADRKALEEKGLKLLEYLPDYASLVRGTPGPGQAA